MYIESVFGNILFEDGSKNLKDCVMNAVLNGIDLSWANLSRTDLFGAEDPTKAGNEMEIQESEFEKLESIQESYYELIMAVENKFLNESRYQTALRLIKEAQGSTQAIEYYNAAVSTMRGII